MGESNVSKRIAAPPAMVYAAFTSAEALEAWQAPDNMTANVRAFDHRAGGGYIMTLTYATDDVGKSGDHEDRYRARFVELVPYQRIVEAIEFETDDPAFTGEMTMTVTISPDGDGTVVTLGYTNLPPGIDPADNDEGTRQSLLNLAGYVEGALTSR